MSCHLNLMSCYLNFMSCYLNVISCNLTMSDLGTYVIWLDFEGNSTKIEDLEDFTSSSHCFALVKYN